MSRLDTVVCPLPWESNMKNLVLVTALALLVPSLRAVEYGVGAQPSVVLALDLNGDGKPDLVTLNPGSGNLSILINNGDGTFQSKPPYALATDYTKMLAVD